MHRALLAKSHSRLDIVADFFTDDQLSVYICSFSAIVLADQSVADFQAGLAG